MTPHRPRPARSLLASLVTLTLALGFVVPGATLAPSVARAQTTETVTSPYVPFAAPLFDQPPPDTWPAPDDEVATAWILVDAATGQVLAEHDADQRRAVASTVKILTALTVVARADLDEEVTVGDEVENVEGSGVELESGDTWTVAQLLDGVISRSGNEAAAALAVHVGGSLEGFLELMRADAAALGLDDPPIVSPSGLDDANQFSARELAVLARAALAHDELRPFFGRRTVNLPSVGTVESRNLLLGLYPDATGVKTGFTLAAGNSLVGSALRDGRELVTVVLDAGEDPARFEVAGQLLDLGFEEYASTDLEGTLRYAVAGGEVVVRVDGHEVVTPTELPPELRFPVTPRPPESDVVVPVEVDGEVLASVAGEWFPPLVEPVASDEDAIGRAMVDGAYAAMRAAAVADVLR